MKWITRERPKIDRIACPWLIKNFVDANAEFIYVPKEQVFDKAKELDAIPYDRKKWICEGKNCKNGTHIRDYGVFPWFMLDRNSKNSIKNPREYWRGRNNFYLCSKHGKMWERLTKRFDPFKVYERICFRRPDDERFIPVSDANMKTVKQIESK